MKKSALLLSALIFTTLFSCSGPKTEEPIEEEQPPIEVPERVPKTIVSTGIPDFQFQFADLQIHQRLDSLDLRAFKHFGEFFTEDFTIFRLDRIDYLAEGYFIDDINLYFIDSVLVKVQAFLREDKSNEFIRRYGKANISINDYHNKQLLKREKLVTKVNGRTEINKNLDNYTLFWKRENLDISYSVNKKNDSLRIVNTQRHKSLGEDNFRYKLTFQAKDFENQMAWVRWEGYKKSRGLD